MGAPCGCGTAGVVRGVLARAPLPPTAPCAQPRARLLNDGFLVSPHGARHRLSVRCPGASRADGRRASPQTAGSVSAGSSRGAGPGGGRPASVPAVLERARAQGVRLSRLLHPPRPLLHPCRLRLPSPSWFSSPSSYGPRRATTRCASSLLAAQRGESQRAPAWRSSCQLQASRSHRRWLQVCNTETGVCSGTYYSSVCLMDASSINVCACEPPPPCLLLLGVGHSTPGGRNAARATSCVPASLLPTDGYATAAIAIIFTLFTLFAACLPAMVSVLISGLGMLWWLAFAITATGALADGLMIARLWLLVRHCVQAACCDLACCDCCCCCCCSV